MQKLIKPKILNSFGYGDADDAPEIAKPRSVDLFLNFWLREKVCNEVEAFKTGLFSTILSAVCPSFFVFQLTHTN